MTMRDRLAARGANGKFEKKPIPDSAAASVESGPVTPALGVATSSTSSADDGLDATSAKLLDETAPAQRAKPAKAAPAQTTPEAKPPASSSAGGLLPLLGGVCAAVLLGVMGYQIVNTANKRPAAPIMPKDKAPSPVQPPAPRNAAQMFTEV